MKKYFLYFNYLLRHKWYVFRACVRRGIIWRGIIHDLSKFRPSEFIPYARYFGGKYPAFEDAFRKNPKNTGLTKEVVDDQFKRAWLAHIHRNPHHWQHWILREDSKNAVCLPMSVKDTKEMLADWEGAGIAKTGKREYQFWYEKNKNKIKLHPRTRALVAMLIDQ